MPIIDAIHTIHIPPNDGPIDEVFVFMSEDERGHGIVSGYIAGIATPLICGSTRVAERIKPIAEEIARRSGKTIKLMRFSNREAIWETNPNNYQRSQEGESDVSDGPEPKHSTH